MIVRWRWVGLCLFLLGLPGCGALFSPDEWPEINGRVRESGTEEPMPGAIVIVRWRGYVPVFPADSREVCYQVKNAVTDRDGRFRVPAWTERARDKEIKGKRVVITVYKAGYEEDPSMPSPDFRKAEPYVRYLKRFNGSTSARLDYLLRISSATRCAQSGESRTNLLALKKGVVDEALTMDLKASDSKKLEILRFGLEALEFGEVQALERMTQRRRGGK